MATIGNRPELSLPVLDTDEFAVERDDKTYKVGAGALMPTPAAFTIETGRWSGSGSDYYITVTASNVTADSILIPQYDVSSAALLNGPVWCVPAAGSFTIHTSAKPSGTVTILVLFPGTMGAAHYEVLADVYSKSQVDSIVAQSTASLTASGTWTPVIPRATISSITRATWHRTGNLVFADAVLVLGSLPSGVDGASNPYLGEESLPRGGGTGIHVSSVEGTWDSSNSAFIGGVLMSSNTNNNAWFYGNVLVADYLTHRLRSDAIVNSTITLHLRYSVNI